MKEKRVLGELHNIFDEQKKKDRKKKVLILKTTWVIC